MMDCYELTHTLKVYIMKSFICSLFTVLLFCFSCDQPETKKETSQFEPIEKSQEDPVPKWNEEPEIEPIAPVFFDETENQAQEDIEDIEYSEADNNVIEHDIVFPQDNHQEPKDMEGIVATHNLYRMDVGVPPLEWSDKLAKSAKSWANELKRQTAPGETFVFKHSSKDWRPGAGENLSWYIQWSGGSSYAWDLLYLKSPAEVVQGWGDERKDYDYQSNTCRPGKQCGHYTQVVWKDTKKVGCAKLNHKDLSNKRGMYQQQELWVCHYEPAGNYIGQRPY